MKTSNYVNKYANDPTIKNASINARLTNRKNVVEACVQLKKIQKYLQATGTITGHLSSFLSYLLTYKRLYYVEMMMYAKHILINYVAREAVK